MSIDPADPTFPEQRRTVVLAAANQQAIARLLYDLVPLFITDHRLHIRFTVIPGSRFEHAAHRFLRNLDLRVIPWKEVRALKPDLIISASPSRKLHRTRAPFIVLAHGAGNHRRRADFGGKVYGVAPQQLLGPRRLLPWLKRRMPTWLPLAGEASIEALARDCPEALSVATVVGDLCLERMLSSLSEWRRYRSALGIARDQKFILVSSTWGDQSLVGQGHADLPERLLASLPMDEFVVGAAPHPNIENGDGGTLRGKLFPQLRNGLIMPPLHEGWRAMVIAADLVIGDSGSVTQYATAIGKPVLLGAFGFDQMFPEDPLTELGREAPFINYDKPFAPQLLDAIERARRFDFDRVLSWRHNAGKLIAAEVYEMLDLSPRKPPEPPQLPPPETVDEHGPTRAWRLLVRFGTGYAERVRLPVSTVEEASGTVVVRADCDDRPLKARADVLLHHHERLSPADAREEIDFHLEDWEHAGTVSVLTTGGHLLVGNRRGQVIGVRCALELIDDVAADLHVWLTEHAPDPAGLDAADSLEDFQRQFETPPTFFSL
ncbi:UDP-N-acetyl glucosamine 2-epimerase [Glycomyces buryatensis]|uniref:UDP-N-acetyl glucosamine 2-epimerase n=1 Tax=Glycomyces buryatensis TaxID=2570927 RepID=A0A4S8Q6U9_9ACTN|nr:UDP-N-acetyl glucosamine 2-epimerase [Glycomyces buryatensis]THV40097.1 UDP-N-acetyl glucosamine 2-epimerase [Glycomyces buryatensis]